MSYRSIKRVLGESSLELKLRILFGIGLLALIGGSFWYVFQITENLVRTNIQVKAQQLMFTQLLRHHLETVKFTEENIGYKGMYQSLSRQIPSSDVELQTRVLQRPGPILDLRTEVADDERERELMQTLATRFWQEIYPKMVAASQPADDSGNLPPPMPGDSETQLFLDRFGGNNEYYFYQPLVFRSVCIVCHTDLSANAEPLVTDPNLDRETQNRMREVAWQKDKPVFFVRVSMPYREFQTALNRTTAILLAVAIATVFVSMLFLYLIVRYVIVKPLKHLQDVSDQIGHGQLDLRADLNTGDEFEELSKSFNRMVRHLIDTQNALRAANRDLDQKIDEQAQLAMHLFEMNRIKSEFLANMSHELRTPLNSILGFSEVLESSQNLNEKQQRYAGNIQRSGRLLLDLINDILDMAKLESGKMDARPSEFAIGQLMEDLVDMVRPLATEKKIDLQCRVDDPLPLLHQDQMKLRQILTNLIANAIKFTPEGGRIKLSASRSGDDLQIRVHDTGVGIADDERELIFEKFRQGASAVGADPLTREHSGTGLGLSIVRELCILLGGKVELESEVGKGSIFTVTLPWSLPESGRANTNVEKRIEELSRMQRTSADDSSEMVSGHPIG